MNLRFLLFLLPILSAAHDVLLAQPSGGPYGPLDHTYIIPEDANAVFYVAPDGDPEADGRALATPTTLEAAVARAETGNAIILRGGVYRVGGLVLNQGITMQPFADEKPVLKGTRLATEWEPLQEGLWRTKWETFFPMKPQSWWRRAREGMYTPLHRFNNDMVFFDGEFLQSAGWEGEVDADSYFIDYESGYLYLRRDPTGHEVEITAWDGGLLITPGEVRGRPGDGVGPTLRGLTFTQYAYRAIEIEGHDPERPEDEALYGKDVVGTVLENLAITYCSRVAAYLRGDHLVVRHCLISDTSTEGLFLLASNDALFERNLFRRNNIEGITGYYPAALKIFNQTNRVVCRENLVTDNRNSSGIWYDVGNSDGIFVNNWLEETTDGFFFEISQRAICAGNVFVDCLRGIRVLNSAGVRIYHNTFLDAEIAIDRTTRSAVGDHFDWHPATGPDVDERHSHEVGNNLLVAEADFPRELIHLWQVPELEGREGLRPQVSRLDGNVFVRPNASAERPLFAFIIGNPLHGSPDDKWDAFVSIEALHATHPEFEAHGLGFPTFEARSALRSPTLRHLELNASFPLDDYQPVSVPEDVLAALGWRGGEAKLPGAYQTLAEEY